MESIQREGWIKSEGWIEYTKGRIDKEKRMESVQWEDESREKDRYRGKNGFMEKFGEYTED